MLGFINNTLNTQSGFLLLLIGLPVLGGLLSWLTRGKYVPQLLVTLLFGGLNAVFALSVSHGQIDVYIPLLGQGMDMRFLSSEYSGLFLVFAAVMFVIVVIYSVSYYKQKKESGLFLLFFFISLAMINGAILSDNMGIMLFFWEGLLCTLFGILLIGNRENPATAVKALAISGTADLLLMLGIVITIKNAGTPAMSEMNYLPLSGSGVLGCICLLLGAMGKAGAMPFHSWIPESSKSATTPFLAAFPASMEKIVGIYLVARVVTQLYDIAPESGMSIFIMTVGAVTLFLGVSMALIQKDMKMLLTWHAISQVGYMILGIGSCLPIGICGGMTHMINHVIYKSGLFIVAGAVEAVVGTTDLRKFSGLGKKMPVTCISFVVFGLSIAGFPGFNGFFSKELIFDAALEISPVFYIVALLGAFMTAASFLKVGLSAFFGKETLPKGNKNIREASLGILIPCVTLAIACIVFGVLNFVPIDKLVGSALSLYESFSGWPEIKMTLITCVVLVIALLDHLYGRKKTGSSLTAVDHIHHAPILKSLYDLAEKGKFDPYNWLMKAVNGFSFLCEQVEKGVSWTYDEGIPGLVTGCGALLQKYSNGKLSKYLITAVAGCVILGIVFLAVLL